MAVNFRAASSSVAMSLNSQSETIYPFYTPFISSRMSLRAIESAHEMLQAVMKEFTEQVLQDICQRCDFNQKYDLIGPKQGEPYLYILTTLCSPYKYTMEAFPKIETPSAEDLTKGSEAFKYHKVFESAIERYTDSRAKPNAVLRETRSNDFCYPVTIVIEAVPFNKIKKPFRLLLLREFQILISIWEQYRNELKNKTGSIDQLVGFPMPFEYCCVLGTDFDLPARSFDTYNYFDIRGNLTDLRQNFHLPLTSETTIGSTLSYMSMEKLGPSITYLMDLVRSQNRLFSLSSALMIFDQLICRLLVMHRYGVIHGDLNTDSLRFGSGNACNVLYISDYSTCVQAPTKGTPGFHFHDRFVSNIRVKEKAFHFVNDFESAYYIFLLLAAGHLPWDGKVRPNDWISMTLFDGQGTRISDTISDLTNVQKEKDSFWDTPSQVQRLIHSREYEIDGALYLNFIEDMMLSIHSKVKDILVNCHRISHETFIHDIGVFGTPASNAYLGIRRTIASYFRFETMNLFLRDPAANAKIGMLRVHDPQDRRAAWDLSSWCWNGIYVDTKWTPSQSPKSAIMQKTD